MHEERLVADRQTHGVQGQCPAFVKPVIEHEVGAGITDDEVLREIAISRRVLAERGPLRPAQTVFFGGGTPTFPNRTEIARLFREKPEYFTSLATVANFFTAFIDTPSYIRERLLAGYGLANARLGRLQLQGGTGTTQGGTGTTGAQRGGMGGLLNASAPSTEVVAALSANASTYTWVAAAIGSQNAAGLQNDLLNGYDARYQRNMASLNGLGQQEATVAGQIGRESCRERV